MTFNLTSQGKRADTDSFEGFRGICLLSYNLAKYLVVKCFIKIVKVF